MAFITRREATKKYRVTYERLVQLEREGKLRKIAAKDAGFAKDKPHQRGGQIKWVYNEEEVVKATRKKPDARFARALRVDALVFDMLAEGCDLIEIVRLTRIDHSEATRLRDIYLREKDGFVVPGEARRVAKDYGFDLKPNTLVPLLVRLLDAARAKNRAKPKPPIRGLVQE